MSVIRIHKKQNNFVILDKTCLYEEKLSWGARGLHAFLMSLPDNWKVRVSDLQKRAPQGRDAVRAFLSELERAGYIKKTTTRNEETGRFGGIEYLVLETPDAEFKLNLPEPDKASADKNEYKLLEPGNPSPGKPEPGNPPLININRININKINNKAAANRVNPEKDVKRAGKSAAAFFQRTKVESRQSQKPISQTITPRDSVISDKLTPYQTTQVRYIVQKIAKTMAIKDEANLFQEIEHCLLSPNYFKACGLDFGRKLNAIRVVIERGEWQTPAGLVAEEIKKISLASRQLGKDLQEAQAEVFHFERLLTTATGDTRNYFEALVNRGQIKIKQLEKRLILNPHIDDDQSEKSLTR